MMVLRRASASYSGGGSFADRDSESYDSMFPNGVNKLEETQFLATHKYTWTPCCLVNYNQHCQICGAKSGPS